MKKRDANAAAVKGPIYWLPRALGVLYAAFLTIFSFDVFEEGGHGILWYAAGFVIHSLPSIILAAAVAFAWKREKAGGILLTVLGVALVSLPLILAVILTAGSGGVPGMPNLVFLPLVVIGALFIVSGGRRKKGPPQP